MRVSVMDNCRVWGELIGVDNEFPFIPRTDSSHYRRHYVGELVTCYQERDDMDVLAVGIVIGLVPHPHPRGDVRYGVVVLWNIDNLRRDPAFDGWLP